MAKKGERRLDGLRITEGVAPGESLRAVLSGVLKAWGREVDDALLSVVLGDAFMLTYAAEASPALRWNIHGRHAFLDEAACDLGIAVYDLHPPDAAPLPTPPPEFATHFRDSYAPFVTAAVERDEPCLAWMGWPPPCEGAWGVVTGVLDDGRCVGRTMFSGAESVEMIGPPVQVYVVNEVRPADIEPGRLIDRVLSRAAVVLNSRLDAKYGVVSGTAAMEAWRDAVREGMRGRGDATGQLHAAIVRQFAAGRKAAMRFFLEHQATGGRGETSAMKTCGEVFAEMTERLTPFAQAQACVSTSSAAYLEGLSKAIDRILPLEQAAAATLADRGTA